MITGEQLVRAGLNTECSLPERDLLSEAIEYANDKYWIKGASEKRKIKTTVMFFNGSSYYHRPFTKEDS